MFFFSSRRRHTRSLCDWSSDVCSSDLGERLRVGGEIARAAAQTFTKVSLEMGGKNANLVFADADLDEEIGRASCRERVWIPRGAGSAKKKGARRGRAPSSPQPTVSV